MAHTPGPWTYRFRHEGTTIEPINGDSLLAVVPSLLGHDLDANARLIAVAPELLESLRDMLEEHSRQPGDEEGQWFTCTCNICTEASYLIVKATQ